MRQLDTHEPGPHVDNIRTELHALVEHLRRDASIVDDAQASALFETSAEVIHGLEVALEHFQRKTEAAWQRAADISG